MRRIVIKGSSLAAGSDFNFYYAVKANKNIKSIHLGLTDDYSTLTKNY